MYFLYLLVPTLHWSYSLIILLSKIFVISTVWVNEWLSKQCDLDMLELISCFLPTVNICLIVPQPSPRFVPNTNLP